MKKRAFFWCWVLFSSLAVTNAQIFRFHFAPGDQYREYSTVQQTILVDGRAQQVNALSYKASYSVQGVDTQGQGQLRGHLVYLTEGTDGGGAGPISEEFDMDYQVDSLGRYTVPAQQVMPVVRGIPTFPERALAVGDTWTAPGEEVHDLSADFGVKSLLHVPVDVLYTYEGPVERDGHTVQVIRCRYTIYYRTNLKNQASARYPVLMTGYSEQKHYFNADKGREEGYEEDYSLVLTLNTRQTLEFTGRGEGHLVEAKTMDKPAVVDQVRQELDQRGLGEIEVRQEAKGVVINMDNIQFPPDSALLLPSEQAKLRQIGEILKRYPDRDILVEGHTALAGTAAARQQLSADRAEAVGDYLLQLGVRPSRQIVYRGWGADHPIASNDTEEDRQKNRRVEITLLEN